MAVPRSRVPASGLPLLIPQSRDPLDTRPGMSGQIPGVHYNVPMYQRLPTQAGDPATSAISPLARIVAGVIGGGAHDLKTNYNPTTVAGAVNLASNFFPGNLHSGLVPKEFPSSVPGVKIVRAKAGDEVVYHTGDQMPLQRGSDDSGSATIAYNAWDNGKIVGSIGGVLRPNETYIDQLYVHPDYRDTPLFQELIRPALIRGKPIGGYVVNQKLGALLDRLQSREDDLGSLIQGVKKHPSRHW